jgi:uncharacterized CHY-type Zn-finger protein
MGPVLLLIMMMAASSGACPLWFRNKSSERCECGDSLGGVVNCNQETGELSLLFCYCMTYSEKMDKTVVGPCLQSCNRRNTPKCRSLNLIETDNRSALNAVVCGDLNRDGVLCGQCREDYALPVYSYTLRCVNCTNTNFMKKLSEYMAVSLLPITVIYIFVILFKLTVNSGPMVAYVLTCQILTSPKLLRAITRGDENHLLLSWFTLWNLDPLRLAYPPFCLHQSMTVLHVLSLDYLVGVYPLFLILLTYSAVTLHDRYPIVVKIWRPAYRVFMCIRREWNIRGSLIQAFATFLILSYVKMLNISFDLLTPVRLETKDGRTLKQPHLFINGEIEFFGGEHLPYGILAIVMLTLFNLLPMLVLFLYPCKFFQKSLKFLKLRSHVHALHSLMDAFQGCYRQSPRDCRYFTGFYILVRVVFLTTGILIPDPAAFAVFGFYFIGLTILVVLVEPYKVRYHNKVDAVFFLLFTVLSFLGGLYSYLPAAEPQIKIQPILVIILTPLSLIFILYGAAILLRRIIPNSVFVLAKQQFKKLASIQQSNSNEDYDDQLIR